MFESIDVVQELDELIYNSLNAAEKLKVVVRQQS
jgi:hypothetical protein